MRSDVAARWLRRSGLALAIMGVSLLGVAIAATVQTRTYQARQGRAFSDLEKRRFPASAVGEPPADVRAADPLVLGMIEIPRIGVSAVVREGDDDATLALAVGHIPGTARLGGLGNVALAGHRDSFFRGLRNIRLHDAIRIRTAGRSDEYFVDSTAVVDPEGTHVLDPTAEAVLTLVTCYPFGWVGHAPNRFIVRASKSRR